MKHTILVAGINHNDKTLEVVVSYNENQLFMEVNNWLFDYCYANHLSIIQAPPLDDWTHSPENSSYWSYTFPNTEWSLWIQTKILEKF